MRIAVVVDDSRIELLMGKRLLEKLGFSVLTAESGEDALNIIRQNSVELVVCDITMSGMSGLELLETAKSLAHSPIFIMATSLDDAGHAVDSMQRGAYGYLTKPLQEEPLRKVIDDAVARRQKEFEAKQELEKLANHDLLTGLYNKDEFVRLLTAYKNSARRVLDYPCALLLVNVDGMRYINNTHGHHEGDRALQHVAAMLKSSVRPTDCVARYGGDVFAIHLKGIAADHVAAKAQNILDAVEREKIELGGKPFSLTVTIGSALFAAGSEIEDSLNNADFALHLAKRQGRNRFHLYQEDDAAKKLELGVQLNSLEIVRRDLDERRFEMHYQPIVSLENGEIKHYEALIRLLDDNGKFLPPAEFIKTAETFGLITKVDCLVVEACLAKAAELADAGKGGVGVAINLSGKSVGDAEVLQAIESALKSNRVDPSRIIFEITETAVFYNLEEVQQFIRRVKSFGCRFALDDFGVGFSSFYYIKQLDIDYLKIDGTFIKNLLESENDQVFVRAMVEICRVFGMQIIAEWVESKEIAELLKTLGVVYGQGYYFGKPGPLA